MGRYSFAAQRVHTHATQLLRTSNNQHIFPPPWYQTIGQVPPAQRLTRPPLSRNQKPGKRSSRIFKPVTVSYKEDELRWEYFNDHPWELARPRIVLENDGRDAERWDWGVELDVALNRPSSGRQRDQFGRTAEGWEQAATSQSARPLNGEAVVQRQNWLLTHTNLSRAAAYDRARKEFYRIRHYRETETRVAREEAQSTGAFFGPGPLEVGMKLEDKAYEDWKTWAKQETAALKQLQGSAYSGTETAEAEPDITEENQEELQEVAESVPATQKGQRAEGGVAVHP